MAKQKKTTYYYRKFLQKLTTTWGSLGVIGIIFGFAFSIGKFHQEVKSDKEINSLLIDHYKSTKSTLDELSILKQENYNLQKEILELKVKISEDEKARTKR